MNNPVLSSFRFPKVKIDIGPAMVKVIHVEVSYLVHPGAGAVKGLEYGHVPDADRSGEVSPGKNGEELLGRKLLRQRPRDPGRGDKVHRVFVDDFFIGEKLPEGLYRGKLTCPGDVLRIALVIKKVLEPGLDI